MGRILLTGVAGFIGSHVADALLARGDDVVGIDNLDNSYDTARKLENLSQSRADMGFRFVHGDVRRESDLRAAFSSGPFDVVVHLAARAGVRDSLLDPLLYDDVNVVGTSMMLKAAKEHEIPHFVQASSSSVYGATSRVPFRESEPADRPSSPYAATKRANEISCYVHHHLTGATVTCLRFFTVYGPRQRPEMAIHKFARIISAGGRVPMFGDGSSTRDYTYVSDIVAGVLAAIDRPNAYKIYNLGTTALMTLGDLVKEIAVRLDLPLHVDVLGAQAGDVPTTYADISLATTELGYSPRVEVRDGLDKFIAWFQQQPRYAGT